MILLGQTKDMDLADDSLRSAVTFAVALGDAEFLELLHEKGKLDQPHWHVVIRHFIAQQDGRPGRRKVAAQPICRC
jgi:hypothetical protein